MTNKSPEFLSKFPLGKIPAFDGADGFKVFEGAAIARYRESYSLFDIILSISLTRYIYARSIGCSL